MTQSSFPNFTPTVSLTQIGQTIPLLLTSQAVEELALAHIVNAEAEKTQFVLGTLRGAISLSPPAVGVTDLLAINSSVRRTMQDVIKKEMLLEFEFENVLDLIASLLPQTFTFTTPGFQTITVPFGATRARIQAVGAAGGNSAFSSTIGGKGASVQGDFVVTPGEPLAIVVGGMGGSTNFGAGGGGGSFVGRGSTLADFLNPANLLVAAGGGGGAGFPTRSGVDASISPNGTDSNPPNPPFGTGGTGGNGGVGGLNLIGFGAGGAGAGVFSSGGNGNPFGPPTDGEGGKAIFAGATGGAAGINGSPGGFGGGGGAGTCGGGGGGYSGGGGGSFDGVISFGGGGGGGSLNNGTNQVNTAGVGTGDGMVIITFF